MLYARKCNRSPSNILDFSSVFQTVNHKLQLYKLSESYSISGKILEWFVSYLPDREKRVVMNGKTSEWVKENLVSQNGPFWPLYLFSFHQRPAAGCGVVKMRHVGMRMMSKSTGTSRPLLVAIFSELILLIFANGLPTGNLALISRNVSRSRSL